MRNRTFFFNLIVSLFFVFTLSSCDVIGDIFEAGIWTGLIGLVLVIVLVFWLFNKMRR
jgi:hypothetical protein